MQNNNIIFSYPPRFPKAVHLYITSDCNLNCVKCYYRSESESKVYLPYDTIKDLFNEWKKFGLKSIAIGGGEPLLHPDIIDIVKLGRKMDFYVAITTNGTILKPIDPHRVHISYDEIHPTWRNIALIEKAIDYYIKRDCKVGINHIMTSLENLEHINSFENVDNVLLIREKPKSYFTQWDDIQSLEDYWLDACREGLKCEQGILSFHVDYELNTSICSNLDKKIRYTTLEETWPKLKKFECKLRTT